MYVHLFLHLSRLLLLSLMGLLLLVSFQFTMIYDLTYAEVIIVVR